MAGASHVVLNMQRPSALEAPPRTSPYKKNGKTSREVQVLSLGTFFSQEFPTLPNLPWKVFFGTVGITIGAGASVIRKSDLADGIGYGAVTWFALSLLGDLADAFFTYRAQQKGDLVSIKDLRELPALRRLRKYTVIKVISQILLSTAGAVLVSASDSQYETGLGFSLIPLPLIRLVFDVAEYYWCKERLHRDTLPQIHTPLLTQVARTSTKWKEGLAGAIKQLNIPTNHLRSLDQLPGEFTKAVNQARVKAQSAENQEVATRADRSRFIGDIEQILSIPVDSSLTFGRREERIIEKMGAMQTVGTTHQAQPVLDTPVRRRTRSKEKTGSPSKRQYLAFLEQLEQQLNMLPPTTSSLAKRASDILDEVRGNGDFIRTLAIHAGLNLGDYPSTAALKQDLLGLFTQKPRRVVRGPLDDQTPRGLTWNRFESEGATE